MTDIVTKSLNQMTTWHKWRIAIFAASALTNYTLTSIGAHDGHMKSGASPALREFAKPWDTAPLSTGRPPHPGGAQAPTPEEDPWGIAA